MIVKSRVMARLEVAEEVLGYGEHEVMQAVGAQLEKAVIAEGESIGAWVREGSVRLDVGGPGTNPFTRYYYGEWCPNPEQGCEFRGGPWDGEIRPMRRERDGKPVEQVVLPNLPQEPSIHDLEIKPVFPNPMPPRYRREGIDSMQDRWVYAID